MKKTLFIKSFFIFSLLTLVFTSCKKDDEGDTSTTGKIIVTTIIPGYGSIAGVGVGLEDSTSETDIQEKVTNSEGKVTFYNVLPGTYRVYAWYVPNQIEEHIGDESFQLIERETKNITINLN